MTPSARRPAERAARDSRARRILARTMTVVVAGALAGCTAPVEPDRTAAELLIQKAADADSSCVAVSQEGEVVLEHSADADEPARAFSVTKSITSLLVGIAQDAGHLSIDDGLAPHRMTSPFETS